MFHGGKFDIIDIPMPEAGMNQNIAPEALPATQTYWLENILPVPKGNGRVRHGTKEVFSLIGNESYDWEIQEIFNYTTSDNIEQLLVYAQVYIQDAQAQGKSSNDEDAAITLITDKPDRYVVDTPIKILYEETGVHTAKRNFIKKKQEKLDETNWKVILYFDKSTFISGMTIHNISFSSGSIYSYDIATKVVSANPLVENLAVNSVPRSVFFQGKLLICNGVDNILQWDGKTLKEVICWIPCANKKKDNLTRIDDYNFTFIKNKKFDKSAFQENATIRLKIDEKNTDLTVSNCMVGNEVVTITINETVPSFNLDDTYDGKFPEEEEYYSDSRTQEREDRVQVMLYCQGRPPKLSYMKVMHNRIFGFGEGAVSLKYRKEAMKVYFSFKPESLEYWHSDITREMPYINMAYEQGRYDSFEAITSVGGNVLFIGRHKSQVWTGKNPMDVNSFKWQSTIDGGVAHGNLLMEVGNDATLVSPQGITSFTMTNAKGNMGAPKLSIKAMDAMNPFVADCVKEIMTSDAKYRQCRAFNYATGGSFIGFKIGSHETIIAVVSTQVNGFSVFSGSFKYTNTFNSGGKKLYMTDGNKVLEYNDDYNDPSSYTDDNVPINFLWSLPIINLKGKKYACKRFEVQTEHSSEFAMHKNNSVLVSVNGDLRKTFNISAKYPMEFQGDVLNTVSLDSGNFKLGVPYQVAKTRLKFMATSFWCSLHGTISTGAFIIKNIRFYGRSEQ